MQSKKPPIFELSLLCKPSKPSVIPCFDIILVHEFGGHPFKTWKPLLSKRKNARVMTFGYSETCSHLYGREELSKHAKELLWELYQLRKEDDTRLRPIIFIGRGAGGFIIKKALTTARLDTQYRDISSCTFGAVFINTPHEFTPDKPWEESVSEVFWSDPANCYLWREGPEGSIRKDDVRGLTDISEAFVRIPGLLVISDKKFGPEIDVDAPESARTIVTSFPIGGLDTSLRPELLSVLINEMLNKSPKTRSKALFEKHNQVLRLLRPHNMWKKEVPEQPTPGTCSWIEAKEPFKKWQRREPDRRLLWIRGDMGCGKTYLARYIVRLVVDPPRSEEGRYRPDMVAYCCIGDITANKTPQSVLAWLLYEILIARPELEPDTRLNGDQLVRDFTFDKVQRLWGEVVIGATKDGSCLTLVVDEVDQLEGSDLGKFFKCITCCDLPIASMVRLLVLSRNHERLEAVLGGRGFGCQFFKYDITPDDTKADIAKTTEEFLGRFKGYDDGSSLAHGFRQQIEDGANGMYLWARFALKEAVKRLKSGNQREGKPSQGKLSQGKLSQGKLSQGKLSQGKLSQGELSQGIYEVFDEYLGQLPWSGKRGGVSPKTILFWITYQAEPMSEEELRIACAMFEKVDDVDSGAQGFLFDKNLKREVWDNYYPLLKIRPDGRIEAVHRSLQEYLRKPSALHNHKFDYCDEKEANKKISFLCVDYLLRPEIKPIGPGYGPSDQEKEAWHNKVEERTVTYPFVRYAALFWIHHARISGDPFHVDLDQWKDTKQRQLLDIQKEGQNEHALWWAEVWWKNSGKGEGFPGSALDLGANFPRRVDDPGRTERPRVDGSVIAGPDPPPGNGSSDPIRALLARMKTAETLTKKADNLLESFKILRGLNTKINRLESDNERLKNKRDELSTENEELKKAKKNLEEDLKDVLEIVRGAGELLKTMNEKFGGILDVNIWELLNQPESTDE